MNDPYISEYGVFVNKLGITHHSTLEAFELSASSFRAGELAAEPIQGNFDAKHLSDIHRYLSQDVYPWAGEFRTVPLFKGGSAFLGPDDIRKSLDSIGQMVKELNHLRGLPKKEAAGYLGRFLCEINEVHPFREGNGRTQRVFIAQLADRAGFDLCYSHISGSAMRNASIAGCDGNFGPMSRLIYAGLSEKAGLAGLRVCLQSGMDASTKMLQNNMEYD